MRVTRYALPAFGAIALAIAAGLSWSWSTTADTAVLVDSSLSSARNCHALADLMESYATYPDIHRGSKIAVLALGASRLNPEPKLLLERELPIPSDDVLRSSGPVDTKKREDFHLAVVQACAGYPETRESPIVHGINAAIAHLRSHKECTPSGHCYLLVQTDGIETVEPQLTKAIKDLARTGTTTFLPLRIHNEGIDVQFCGSAEVLPRPAGTSVVPTEKLQELWRSVFTHPDLLQFRPFCRP
jgi:hypothetical protein